MSLGGSLENLDLYQNMVLFIVYLVNIQVKDEYVKFSFEGEMGDGVVTLHETMKEH